MSQVFFLEHIILIGILFLLNVYNVDSFTDAAITASKHTNGQTMERPLQVCIMQFNINFFCLTKCMYTSNKNCTGTLIFKFENLLFIQLATGCCSYIRKVWRNTCWMLRDFYCWFLVVYLRRVSQADLFRNCVMQCSWNLRWIIRDLLWFCICTGKGVGVHSLI